MRRSDRYRRTCSRRRRPLSPETVSDQFGRNAKTAGLPAIRFHDIRHSHAVTLGAAGVPIKVIADRLGHASASITLDVYSHVLPSQDEEAAATAAALVDGGRTRPSA